MSNNVPNDPAPTDDNPFQPHRKHGTNPDAWLNSAAVYVRMSTEHQQYSTSNQMDVIREYAKKLSDEVQDVAAVLAFAEAIPDVLFSINPELRGVAAAVDRAWPAQAVAGAFERVENTVVLQDVFHGDPGTNFPKIYEWFFWHRMTPFNVLLGEQNR